MTEAGSVYDALCPWKAPVRDPGLTPMDMNDYWRFDQGDSHMENLFATVLGMAADDLLARLRMWPNVPVDSFSSPPVFDEPVEWEARSRWRTDAGGRLDLHFAASSPVHIGRGFVGPSDFTFEHVHERVGPMLSLGPAALGVLTGDKCLEEWAGLVGLSRQTGVLHGPSTATERLRQVDTGRCWQSWLMRSTRRRSCISASYHDLRGVGSTRTGAHKS